MSSAMLMCQDPSSAMYQHPTRHSPVDAAYNCNPYHTTQPQQYATGYDYSQYNIDPAFQQQWPTTMHHPATTRQMEDWTNNFCVAPPTISNPAFSQAMAASYYNNNLNRPASASGLEYQQNSSYGSAASHSPSMTALGSPESDSITSSPCTSSDSISPCNSGGKNVRVPFDWMKQKAYQNLTTTAPCNGKTRTKDKYRVVYTDHQRLELEKEFHYSRYITIRRKAELAQTLSLSERQVKIWFQNRRAKERKMNKKKDEITQINNINDLYTECDDVISRTSPVCASTPLLHHQPPTHTPMSGSFNQIKAEISPLSAHHLSDSLSPLARPLNNSSDKEQLMSPGSDV